MRSDYRQRAQVLLSTLVYILGAYAAHWWLQRQYYVHCRSNVLRVLLFQRSDMCVMMQSVIHLIEGNYATIFHGALGFGGAAAAAAAYKGAGGAAGLGHSSS